MHVCPVEQCITMERVDSGAYSNWTTHPNNPSRASQEVSPQDSQQDVPAKAA
jgi:dihydropyrimidine dehydrogenase (NAD+) subunit PreA